MLKIEDLKEILYKGSEQHLKGKIFRCAEAFWQDSKNMDHHLHDLELLIKYYRDNYLDK